ncbi:MAG: asparaginase [Clostridia bacterium]|nr:asparaginase [Clostridia bacterium]
MKQILLILVGGTICCGLNEEGTLSVSEKAGMMLCANFKKSGSPYAQKVQIDTTENMFILSENMTVDKWNHILDTYQEYTAKKAYDGVIIAHGTDTLAYSAALFSMLLAGIKIPVFFVSSQKRLELSEANGNDNFRCAVECIARGIVPNVYVPYRNLSDGRMYLHLGSRIEQCQNYSDDFFSQGMIDITDITEKNYRDFFAKIETLYPQKKAKPLPVAPETRLSDCVLQIKPYVGIRYDAYDYDKFSAVLHGTYHSGTACAETDKAHSLLCMIRLCSESEHPIDAYLSPSKLSGEIYETVSTIGKSKISFLYGYTWETAYAKLLIAYSLMEDSSKRATFLATEHNFEKIDSEKTVISKE